ncbi:hypothetical protein SAMN05444411_10467 [Lutibacter oricola]|uniref:Uncharacterized protein n=1 Tax=Lutibacter oricola TaxID=762486 RepID=A0A1H3A9U3_9FLAO|nr:hypothetical protein [Lutibacter oricola]SDX26403.1 hypothetical protein SAMN05444411_10467 [Lutibacter oricola]
MKDNIENIFEQLENQFDIEEPTIGHFNRFESKLNAKKEAPKSKVKLYSLISVAASIILLVGIWIGGNISNSKGVELAQISNEMEETQSYFVSTIEKELETIELERNTDNEQLINDALHQLNKLETQYQALTFELKESTEDKRIIYAMISNFQQRIELLQTLLQQIENVKQLKQQNNEIYV